MANILIVYSTTDGHTRKICQRLQQVVEQRSHRVEMVSLSDEPHVDPTHFDKVVIGASVRYGKHRPQVYQFIQRNQLVLARKPSAFFSVNLVARKAEKCQPDTNPYVKVFLKQSAWKPRAIAVFAGKIDYQKYSFRDRMIIRLIMWITKGPTDLKIVKEFTDWEQVEAFGRVISEM